MAIPPYPRMTAPIPSYLQQVNEATDTRVVRTEAEFRGALAECVARFEGSDFNLYQYVPGFRIVCAGVIRFSEKLVIPAEAAGVCIEGFGSSALLFPNTSERAAITVNADWVTISGLHVLPDVTTGAGVVLPAAISSENQISALSVSGCVLAGVPDALYFPSGVYLGRFLDLYCYGLDIRGVFDNTAFAGANGVSDVFLLDGSSQNMFSACDIGDVDIDGSSSQRNVFSGCIIGDFDDASSNGLNAVSGSSISGSTSVHIDSNIAEGNV